VVSATTQRLATLYRDRKDDGERPAASSTAAPQHRIIYQSIAAAAGNAAGPAWLQDVGCSPGTGSLDAAHNTSVTWLLIASTVRSITTSLIPPRTDNSGRRRTSDRQSTLRTANVFTDYREISCCLDVNKYIFHY